MQDLAQERIIILLEGLRIERDEEGPVLALAEIAVDGFAHPQALIDCRAWWVETRMWL